MAAILKKKRIFTAVNRNALELVHTKYGFQFLEQLDDLGQNEPDPKDWSCYISQTTWTYDFVELLKNQTEDFAHLSTM